MPHTTPPLTGHMYYGRVGSALRAQSLAQDEGVYWSPDLDDIIVTDATGLLRLMDGGFLVGTGAGIEVRPSSGSWFTVWPL